MLCQLKEERGEGERLELFYKKNLNFFWNSQFWIKFGGETGKNWEDEGGWMVPNIQDSLVLALKLQATCGRFRHLLLWLFPNVEFQQNLGCLEIFSPSTLNKIKWTKQMGQAPWHSRLMQGTLYLIYFSGETLLIVRNYIRLFCSKIIHMWAFTVVCHTNNPHDSRHCRLSYK